MTLSELVTRWRSDAEVLNRRGCNAVADVLTRCAAELDAARSMEGDGSLTLQQASAESGYSESRLRHLVAAGELQNAGKKGAPRIRRSDLPKKAAGVNVFDATAAARRTA